jgi:hypothetical protein
MGRLESTGAIASRLVRILAAMNCFWFNDPGTIVQGPGRPSTLSTATRRSGARDDSVRAEAIDYPRSYIAIANFAIGYDEC